MFLQVTINFGSQNKERFHVKAVFHNLNPILHIRPHFFAVNVVSAGQFAPLLSFSQNLPDFWERVELNLRWSVTKSINYHPLADQQITSNRHRSGKHYIGDYTDECTVAHSVAHVGLEKGDIVLIIRPFSEIVEGGIEEAVHDGHDPREVNFIKKRYNYKKNVNWRVVNHLKDEGLDEVTQVGYGVDFFPDIQLGHALFVLFCFPDYYLHCLPGHIHIIEDEIAVGENQREAHYDPT